MQFGTMSILFREQLGTDEHIGYIESLTRIRRAGFTNADLNLCQLCAYKTTLHLPTWQRDAEQIAQTAQDLGLSLPQCHLPFKSKKTKWQTAEDYAFYIEMFYRAVDVAAVIGFPWAVVHPDRYPLREEMDLETLIQENHKEYDPLVDYALKKGVNIAFENMNAGHFAKAEELVEYIDSYHDDRVGACWDTGHANMYYKGGDQWEPLHTVGHRLHCTHIADNRAKDDLHLLPWEGTIDWPRVIAAMRDISYDGALILEPFINNYSPDHLKDINGRYAFEVMRLLEQA